MSDLRPTSPLAVLVCLVVQAAVVFAGQERVEFSRRVQPLLASRCFECHGPDAQESGVRLDQRDVAVQPGESGARAIVPRDPAASELLRRVSSDDPDSRMPPDGDPLRPDEVALLRDWIQQGAGYEKHWAYRKREPGPLPAARNSSWARNPIDQYVLAVLEEAGVEPSPAADNFTLIRRLHTDLLGLPPDPDAVREWMTDPSDAAWEQLVDRLLASEHFGERWGRHWLDKARYADSDGYEKDNVRPHAWHYRDWVIRAINQDLPFDQFTIQQLAGDLLPEASEQTRLATAFNRQTLTNTEGGTDKEEWRVAAVMDRTETLGIVWLGLTVGCARCHNHKYDAIRQDEYYSLYAFFNNGDETTMKLAKPAADAKKKTAVRVISERATKPRETHILERGDFLRPGRAVQAGALESLHPLQQSPAGERPTRLDLARWLVAPENPLTARVVVNHAWKHLFGEGLVRTLNDFGVRGEPPTHPRLLDYLADRLVREGWSRKRLIRDIVMSATWRQSSRHRPELRELDPTNRLLHRQNRFRVDAEIIRDFSLSAAGLLSPKVGGPSVFPPIPSGITDLTYNSSFKWKVSEGEDRYRRGMYTFFKRTAPHPNLITFDCPDSNVTTVERDRSNTPIGALVTLNNPVYVEAAQGLARRVLTHDGSDEQRLELMIRVCLTRGPDSFEVQRLKTLLEQARTWYSNHPPEAGEMAGSLAPRVAAVEQAAWAATARMVLNLDEFLTRG